jgi:hypothetical protein
VFAIAEFHRGGGAILSGERRDSQKAAPGSQNHLEIEMAESTVA